MSWFSLMSAIAAGVALGHVLGERICDAHGSKDEHVSLTRKYLERKAREARGEGVMPSPVRTANGGAA